MSSTLNSKTFSIEAGTRWPWIDLIKVVAANLIVWHHLAFYGPMADAAWALAPDLFTWLARHARMAVQAFLVVGGFLAVQAWLNASQGQRLGVQSNGIDRSASRFAVRFHELLRALGLRYVRLVLPYTVMLFFAILATAWARAWMPGHASLPEPSGPVDWVAHVALVQTLLDRPAVSAGVWYVAIDFQLHALWLTIVLLGRGRMAPVMLGATALTAVSLWVVNRHATWDVSGLYFFGAYGLGLLAGWSVRQGQRVWGLLAILTLLGVALALSWRTRLAVAGVISVALVICASWPWRGGFWRRCVAQASMRSYALFLLHFPVCLVVNATFTRWAPATEAWQGFGLLMAWGASLIAAHVFHRWVEGPCLRWTAKRRLLVAPA